MTTKLNQLFLMALVFAFAPLVDGQTLEVLHLFQVSDGGDSRAALIQGNDGNFYGTAAAWGDTSNYVFGYGTVFKITQNGAFAVLASFNNTNGASPRAALVQGSDGAFYGTTYQGGASNLGTVFKIMINSNLTSLMSFTNDNGASPLAGLIQGHHEGDFYGTTSSGGANNYGTIFKITAYGDLTTLVHFNNSNGASPRGNLILGKDGHFYGTTFSGGSSNLGTVFRMTTNGTLNTLVSFNLNTARNPQAGLVEGRNGDFYGTSWVGGLSNVGTVFRVTTNGTLSTLVTFNYTNGSYPQAELNLGTDDNFYGTTAQGSTNDLGTVFRMTSDGVLTTLASFPNYSVGIKPLAGVTQGRDGNWYGATPNGGQGIGAIYRIVMPVSLNYRVNNNELVLSWPTNAVGFTLQSAADLSSSTDWVDFTNAPVVVGAQFTVTNLISDTSRLFRLKKP